MSYIGIKFNGKVLNVPQEYLKSIDISDWSFSITDAQGRVYTFNIPDDVAKKTEVEPAILELQEKSKEHDEEISLKANSSDLTNYVDLASEQTISGKKTISSPLWIESPEGSYKSIVIKSSGTSNRPSVNIGNNNIGDTWGSVALGYGNTSISNNTVAIGSSNSSSHNCSYNIMIGSSLKAGRTGNEKFRNNIIIGHRGGSVANSSVGGNNNVVIGYNAVTGYTENKNNIVDNAIQLGTGTNLTSNTFQVFDYQLLDAEGKIPNERLAVALEMATNDDIDTLFV